MSELTPNYTFSHLIYSVKDCSASLSFIAVWILAINHFCATNFHTQSGSNLGIFSDSLWRWDVFLSLCSHVFVKMVSEAKTLMSPRGHPRLLAVPTLSVSALTGLSGTKLLPSDASREHISINNGAFLPLYLHASPQTSKHSSVCIYIWASDHQAHTVECSYCAWLPALSAWHLCVANKQNADILIEN